MSWQVDGNWNGWDGKTLVLLTDGSIYEQAEYHYEYRYSYRPKVFFNGHYMLVEGMSKGVLVRRVR